jgi:hypothetical protein
MSKAEMFMKLASNPWTKRIRPYVIGFLVFIVLGLIGQYMEKQPWGQAKKADTLAAYEKFVKENPDDSHIAEAKQRIRQITFSFRPKFFLIYEANDLSREIGLFDFSITSKEEESETLAYVNAPDFDTSGGCRVIVRLVDKTSKRERTIVATSTAPEWQRVTVVTERVTASGGGSHTIDGHYHKEALNGQGLLLAKVLDYAQTLESDKP